MEATIDEIGTPKQLENAVAELGSGLQLEAKQQVRLGRRVWGARRFIDVVLTHPETGVRLGIECKFQRTKGTAEEKVAGTVSDIEAWPIRGLVVIHGPGFSENVRAYLLGTGKVIDFEDIETWLRFFFGLELVGSRE